MTIAYVIASIILLFIILFRSNVGEQTYKFVKVHGGKLYSHWDKIASEGNKKKGCAIYNI